MGTDNVVFLEVIEWFDSTGKEIVHRIPEKGSGEIKYGAQLIVRESQAAVFFYNGKAYDAFPAGRHTLITGNIPIITKLRSTPWGMTSPLRAEVYIVNMKVFPNLRWGTRDPVAFRDSQLGLVRLRAFGVFSIRVLQPVLFINSLVGTQGIYMTEEIEEYLSRIVVSRLNDYLGEHLDTIFDLPGQYGEISEGLTSVLRDDFSRYGLGLPELFIGSVTPPLEVQKAIDDKSRLGVFDDLNSLIKLKTAMAIEKASEQKGDAGSSLGVGLGLMLPGMFADMVRNAVHTESSQCPSCRSPVQKDARFCSCCGHQILVYDVCKSCGRNLLPGAGFCSSCGRRTDSKPDLRTCGKCGADNLPESVFCNNCGEKLQG